MFDRSYHKVGGPIDGETSKKWKARLQNQLSVECAAQQEEPAVRITPRHEEGTEESAPARVVQQDEGFERHDRSPNEGQPMGRAETSDRNYEIPSKSHHTSSVPDRHRLPLNRFNGS